MTKWHLNITSIDCNALKERLWLHIRHSRTDTQTHTHLTTNFTCWKKPDLCVRVLTHVSGRVDCFGYVCALQTQSYLKHSLFYNICVLMFMYYCVCYFTGSFYVVIRQISMLLVDNKDSVFSRSIVHSVCLSQQVLLIQISSLCSIMMWYK